MDDSANSAPEGVGKNNSEADADLGVTKKHPKKMLIIGVVVFIALVGGSMAWFMNRSGNKQAATNESQQSEPAKQITTLTKDTLFFKHGNKLVAYDPVLQVQQILTDKLTDEEAQILDFYTNYQDEWRAYVLIYAEDERKVVLYTNDAAEVETSIPDNSSVMAANAKQKLFVYDQLPGFEPDQPQTTRSFVVRNEEDPQLIRESSPQSEEDALAGDIDNPLYFAADISPDGKKVLFQQAECFNCDGGYNSRSFEINLETEETETITTDETLGNNVFYKNDGKVAIIDSNLGGLGDVSKVDVTLLTEAKDDGRFEPVARVQNDYWRLITANSAYELIAAEVAADTTDEFSTTMFDGFYRLGATIGEYNKVAVKNLPADISVNEIGEPAPESKNDCFGLSLAYRSGEGANLVNDTYEIGYICASSEGELKYTKILKETLRPGSDSNYVEPTSVL